MVVDDSAVIRGLLSRALEADPDIRVVASVGNGQMAVNTIARQPIDVVVLDIEMPVMDGLTALPQLIKASPATKVIMASTLTKRNADISLRALKAGASDYLAKPGSGRDLTSADAFKQDLLAKVKALGGAAHRAAAGRPGSIAAARPAAAPRAGARPVGLAPAPRPIVLRPMPTALRPRVIAIGSSTGGPQALFEVVEHLAGLNQPILITQHMPATFTTILAEHLSRQCKVTAAEAVDGEPLAGGRVYVAPGEWHMTVQRGTGASPVIRLLQTPPENFCRPAVDPMLRSLVALFGRDILTVILTGMGQDGLKGCTQVVQAGGAVVAQDETSSVVWGMPGAVSTAGLASAVLPIGDIGPFIRKAALRSAA